MLAVLTIALGLSGLPGVCRAAELLGQARPGGVPEVLASVTSLSEEAMAHESAAGVQATPVITEQNGHARVLLWDELRAPPEAGSAINGTVTLSTGGAGGK